MVIVTTILTAFAALAFVIASVPNGTTHVVAPAGGDFASIAAAVEAADDGDTIRVGPGLYTETVRIDKSIEVVGDGDRGEIIVEAPQDPDRLAACQPGLPFDEELGCAFVLVDTDATLRGLTLRGDSAGVMVYGGAPLIEGLDFERTGEPWGRFEDEWLVPSEAAHLDGHGTSITLREGSRARIVGNRLRSTGPIMVEGGSAPTIEGNVLSVGSWILISGVGDGARVVDNEIGGSFGLAAINGTFDPSIDPSARVEISGNVITGNADKGIDLPVAGDYVVSGNRIEDNGGIAVIVRSAAEVRDNVIVANEGGINIIGADATLVGNRLERNTVGVLVNAESPTLEANTITGGGVGLRLMGPDAAPILSGNTICGNDEDTQLQRDASEPDTSGDEVC